MSVDLHLHSTASDGSLSPTELVKKAKDLSLKAIAITDHDSVKGISEALEAAEHYGIEIISGVELSSVFDSYGQYQLFDLHFLGYFIDYENPSLQEHLDKLHQARHKRAFDMIMKLKKAGLNISFEEVEKLAAGGSLGRPHIAQVLVKQGYAANMEEAFKKYLYRGSPYYVEKTIYSPEEIIGVIKRAGGIACLAHPGLYRCDGEIARFMEAGMQGIEVWHSDHTVEQINFYYDLAKKMGLVAVGGSDCHGPVSLRGCQIGNVTVSDRVLVKLREIKDQRAEKLEQGG